MVVLTKIATKAIIDSENHGSAISTAIAAWSTITQEIATRRATGWNRANTKPSWTMSATYVATPTTRPKCVNRSLRNGNGRNSCSCSG